MAHITDKKDKKILYQLDKDARAPISSIAAAVGLSKELVAYRMRALEKKGIIKGYYAMIDVPRLGYMFYRILIKLQNMSDSAKQRMIQYLTAKQSIAWVGTLDGEWDMVVLVWAQNPIEFKQLYDDIVNEQTQLFLKTHVTIATKIHHYLHNYLFDTDDTTTTILGNHFGSYSLDEIDKKILSTFTKNCRTPLLELSKHIGVAANTLKYRIKKLKENTIILGYRVMIDTAKLGYEHFKVFVTLKDQSQKNVQKLIGHLQFQKNVIYVTEALGTAHLEFEVVLPSYRELHDFLTTLKQEFSHTIHSTQTLLTYEEHYINYFPLLT